MSILSRYVLRQHLAPAATGLAIFYFVLSMDFIVDYLRLFIAKGVSAPAVLEAFALSLAWMTVLAVPMAVMVAVLTTFGKLSGDNEITACKANGVNVFSLMFPVLISGALIACGLFVFGNRVLPAANHRLKTLLVDIHKIRPLATIEPGILTELPGGYTIIAERMDSHTSELFGIRIHRIEPGEPPQTIVAARGHIAQDEAQNLLRIQLYDGEIHEMDSEDPTRYNRLLFDRHVINLEHDPDELIRSERAKRGDRELSVAELSQQIAGHRTEINTSEDKIGGLLHAHLAGLLDMADGTAALASHAELKDARTDAIRKAEAETRSIASAERRVRKLEVEYHKKLSLPLSCIVFVLLGAPLGIRSKRGGVGIGAGIGIIFFLVYYLFLVGGEQLGDRGIVSPFWAMWSPTILFAILGISLTVATVREWRLFRVGRALDFVLRKPPARPAAGTGESNLR